MTTLSGQGRIALSKALHAIAIAAKHSCFQKGKSNGTKCRSQIPPIFSLKSRRPRMNNALLSRKLGGSGYRRSVTFPCGRAGIEGA